jgi:hypothetical protein
MQKSRANVLFAEIAMITLHQFSSVACEWHALG